MTDDEEHFEVHPAPGEQHVNDGKIECACGERFSSRLGELGFDNHVRSHRE